MVEVKYFKTLPSFEQSSPSIDIRWLPEEPQNDKNDEVDQNNYFWETEILKMFLLLNYKYHTPSPLFLYTSIIYLFRVFPQC